MEQRILNTINTIKDLEIKPSNNKVLREAFKIFFPYGTVPKNIDKLKESVINIIQYKKEEQNYYDKGIEIINLIENNFK